MTGVLKPPHELGEGKVKLRAIGHDLHWIGLNAESEAVPGEQRDR